jgi:GntR family transcriptional regulator
MYHVHQRCGAHTKPAMTSRNDGARRPRYVQVREQLVERIQTGAWAPGRPIPSEFDIAKQFGVSQGTVRMAVTALVAEKIVTRQQGLGTFVYEHTREEELERFWCVFDGGRERIDADTRSWRPVPATASRAECRELNLAAGSKVLRARRVRLRDGAPFILERISLPEALFAALAAQEDLPDMLYGVYQGSCAVMVVEVEERLTAVLADRGTGKALGIAAGTPLLRIERLAFALQRRPVEWRVSLFHLAAGAHYLARLK